MKAKIESEAKMKINFVGGGNMAAALIGGLCAAHQPPPPPRESRAAGPPFSSPPQAGGTEGGHSPSHRRRVNKAAAIDAPPRICAADISPKARAALRKQFGIKTVASPAQLPGDADIVVLAVKPQHLRAAAAQTALDKSALLISVVAGVRVKTLSRRFGDHRAIVRAMPNTPALIGVGMTAAFAAAATSRAQRETAQAIFAAVGDFIWLKKEAQIEAATAVSGAGPAYLYYLVEAMEAAAASAGLPAAFSRRAILQTVRGAQAMVAKHAADKTAPQKLRQAVTSPAGVTERAIAALDSAAAAAAIRSAVAAARQRAIELGEEADCD